MQILWMAWPLNSEGAMADLWDVQDCVGYVTWSTAERSINILMHFTILE
jgi:hypothetical protein